MDLPPLTRQQVRSVDRIAIDEFGISGLVLMENAGRGAAEIIGQQAPLGEILILCGRGNNAGDGYVIARHLELMGRRARIVSLVEISTLAGDALSNAEIAEKAKMDIRVVATASEVQSELISAETIVECLLGTGASGAPRGLYADAVHYANQANAIRIAIDIPAGLDCDSGVASEPTLKADHTITFVAAKVGFEKADGPDHVGIVHPVGIGVPRILLETMIRNENR